MAQRKKGTPKNHTKSGDKPAHKVEPRQIVGALANEGGLDRTHFGRIDIRGAHSLVELPADLPQETRAALSRTRISGRLIALRPEGSPAPQRPTDAKPRTKPRTKPRSKPRSKNAEGA